ncbi:MAG: hypothetical protein RSA29_09770 [Clostridium sp.]|uniref:hypothetical protein n=1 Tax=Clostridium sp. TaxID=1506 RepID=UPI003040F2A1
MGILIFLTAVVIKIVFVVLCIITKSNQQRLRSIIRIVTFATKTDTYSDTNHVETYIDTGENRKKHCYFVFKIIMKFD